jgi:hypothetical protein
MERPAAYFILSHSKKQVWKNLKSIIRGRNTWVKDLVQALNKDSLSVSGNDAKKRDF